MAHHVNKINNLKKLIYSVNEMFYTINRFQHSQYNKQTLKSTPFILNEYYKNNSEDWKQYINTIDVNKYGYHKYNIFDDHSKFNNSNYFKNNLKFSIVTWLPDAKTDFHLHLNNGCIMMPLKGYLTQNIIKSKNNILHPNDKDKDKDNYNQNTLFSGEYSYIDDEIGMHRILNTSNNIAVSINIYQENNVKEDEIPINV